MNSSSTLNATAHSPQLVHNASNSPLLLPAIYLACACAGISIAQFGALAQWINHDLSLSATQAGLAQTMFFVGHLVGCLLMGRSLSRLSTRQAWLTPLIIIAVGTALSGVAWYPCLLLGRTIVGAGFSSTILVATAIIVSTRPQQASMLLSAMHGLIAMAASLTLLVCRPLAEMLGTWTATFWVSAIITTLPIALSWITALPRLTPSPPASFTAMRQIVKHPVVRGVLPLAIGYVMVEQALTVFAADVATTRHAMQPAAAASVTAMLWVGIIFGRFAVASMPQRLPVPQQMVLGAVVMGASILAATRVEDLWSMRLLMLIAGYAGGPIVPLAFAWIGTRLPDRQAVALTTCQVSCCMGGLLGPMLIGLGGDRFGLTAALATGGAIYALICLPLWLVGHNPRTEQTRQPQREPQPS